MINIKELRIGVEETFGEKITTAKQCRMLEEAILAESNRRISSATLRRFFGLLPSSSKISPYNVDTLVIYSRFNQEKFGNAILGLDMSQNKKGCPNKEQPVVIKIDPKNILNFIDIFTTWGVIT